MRVGGIEQEVICDEITGFIYYPNPNATDPYNLLLPRRTPYSPEKMATIQENPAEEETMKDKPEDARTNPAPSETNLPQKVNKSIMSENDSFEENEKKKKGNKHKNKSLKGKVVALGIIIAIALGGACVAPIVMESFSKSDSGNQEPTPAPDQEVPQNASIVQVVRNLIPGDVIKKEDLQEAVISNETYNQITLQGVNLYQWAKADTLVGMYAQNYLPSGQYVSFSSVGAVYEPPQSLWNSDTYIDLILNEEQQTEANFIPGQKVNVVVRKEIITESPVTQDNGEIGGGGAATTFIQTSTINEYSFPNTTVCDVFTGDSGDGSLYQTLHAISSVPAGEQGDYLKKAMKDESFANQFKEKIVRVYVSQTDRDKIGDISNLENVSIFIESADDFCKDNDERAAFVATAQATMQNVKAALEAQEETKGAAK